MACVTSVSYSVLINGAKFGQLFPTRGLRQGDPLSPYLFLLCAEGLSSLFHHFEAAGRIQGMRCGRNGPTISHLFFADDSLLFFEASTDSCLAVKEALAWYETASGQLVSYSKSAVCFGPNVAEDHVDQMTASLGVPKVRKTSSASFVWRSILWGRELLMQGSRRKIGSGNDTYIYHDRWLPRDGSFRISSPRVLGELSKVSLLKTAMGQ
ncbi:hypothetical protein UlMin_020503 [Ulmus minor]